jgi:hypothetical protein
MGLFKKTKKSKDCCSIKIEDAKEHGTKVESSKCCAIKIEDIKASDDKRV